jgi:hypothetical protein
MPFIAVIVPTFGPERRSMSASCPAPINHPKRSATLIDRLEAAREELLKIQRSFEDFDPIRKSVNGSLKIVARHKLILPTPKQSPH